MLYGIQYLRGVAALIVLFFHSKVSLDHYIAANGNNEYLIGRTTWDTFGKTGVDIFFVISGLVITLSFSKIDISKTNEIKFFLKKRIVRIVPAFWIATALYLALIFLTSGKIPDWQHILSSSLFIPYEVPWGLGTVLPVGWTLNYEMLFYISLSFMAVFFQKKAFQAIIAQFLVFSIFFYIWGELNSFQRFVFNPQSLEFAFGVIIGLFLKRELKLNKMVGAAILVIGTLGLLAVGFRGYGDGYIGRVVYAGIPAALIVLGATSEKLKAKDCLHKLLKSLGDASYSIYLTHITSIALIASIFEFFGVYIGSRVAVIGYYSFVSFLSIMLGIVFYKMVERPVTKAVHDRLIRPH
ncbi:acyltransferase [Kushneria pakistanensis]|uniref:Acyltransferase n=1 Tax=Kushneria pakistanensis TaxID=1508770 RepID=A0ABQ3FMK5_9GAMM|nr:acyltransferase [Kushneria pakistanensis]GHC29876.1 acyltransferase [Kushneria pakistanensis]